MIFRLVQRVLLLAEYALESRNTRELTEAQWCWVIVSERWPDFRRFMIRGGRRRWAALSVAVSALASGQAYGAASGDGEIGRWFRYLLVLVETGSGMVGSGFVQPAGDRCNDGHAQWDRFSENGNGIYMRNATPFRLVNPLDETDWRAAANAMLFEGKDEEAQRAEMLATANPPLYSSWLPYRELENCAACCAGKIVVMQNMLGTEIDSGIDGGRDYRVLGVVLDREAVAALATSEKVGDRCLAAGLDKAAAAAKPSGPDGRNLFIYRDRWLQIRDGLAAGCGE